MLIAGFIGPLQAFLASIPSCIFGGCAAILYGYITLSGIRTIKDNNIDFNNNKNVVILASILTLGVSGAICDFGVISFGTTALAMIVGIVLNLILKDRTYVGLRAKLPIIEDSSEQIEWDYKAHEDIRE